MKCPSCHTALDDHASFCRKCGRRVAMEERKKSKKPLIAAAVCLGAVLVLILGYLLGSYLMGFFSGENESSAGKPDWQERGEEDRWHSSVDRPEKPEATVPVAETVAPATVAPAVEETEPKVFDKQKAMEAVNYLLAGIPFDPEKLGPSVEDWSDADVSSAIYGILLRDYFNHAETPLRRFGLEASTSNQDGYLHYDLELVQKLAMSVLGREVRLEDSLQWAKISGDEFLMHASTGEATHMVVQDVIQDGNIIYAVGPVVFRYNGFSEFGGYFKAVCLESPDSLFGYTLLALEDLGDEKMVTGLTATASSELQEPGFSHYAQYAVDNNWDTAWVEGVPGVGINQWIELRRSDGGTMELSAIEFINGYQKSQHLLERNGWPMELLIECEGGYSWRVWFHDYEGVLLLEHPIQTTYVRITILDALAGTHYEDTCITEIRLRGITCRDIP